MRNPLGTSDSKPKAYLVGQGSLISRSIMGITKVIFWVIRVTNLSPPDPPSRPCPREGSHSFYTLSPKNFVRPTTRSYRLLAMAWVLLTAAIWVYMGVYNPDNEGFAIFFRDWDSVGMVEIGGFGFHVSVVRVHNVVSRNTHSTPLAKGLL